MQILTGRKPPQAALLAAFIMLTACGQNTDLSSVQEETMSEEEVLLRDGTGSAPEDLEKLTNPDLTVSEQAQALANYGHLDPKRVVPSGLLKKAVLYYDANKSRIANKKYISVIDFSKKSSKARFYIVDMANGSVWAIHTSHGKGSDSNHDGYADSFGNVLGSGKSSLGVYKTAETYYGSHGYSLRLDGLSSTNSRARSRAIVIHPASYVSEASVRQGRSLGCPAVAPSISKKVIDRIKGGSIIYAGLSGVR